QAKVLVEPVADVVAVEHVSVAAKAMQLLLDEVGDRRLARRGETRGPQHARLLALQPRVGAFVDVDPLPADVPRAMHLGIAWPGADDGISDPVYHPEAAGIAVPHARPVGEPAQRFAAALARVVQPPQLRPLVLWVPPVLGRAEREDPLLGARALLVAANTAK